MITENEKKKIRARAKEPLGSYDTRESNQMNPPVEMLDDCNNLIDEANKMIFKNKLDGPEILLLVDQRAIEIEKILKNYE